MKVYHPRWQFAEAPGSAAVSAPYWLRRRTGVGATPVSQQVISWLLFWPVLTLIARQSVYFSGPARSAAANQNGAAISGARGSHYYLYVYLLFLLGFVLAGHRQILAVIKEHLLLPAMLALGVCSAMWSASPQITLQMCIQVGLCTFFACYLSARFTTERLMEFLIFMGVASALLSILFVFALPSYGIFQGYAGNAWQGICDHKNSLGIGMTWLLTPIFFTNAYSRGRKLMYSALLLFLIFQSQSRGAWAFAAGMLAFVGWMTLMRHLHGRELTLLLLLTGVGGLTALGLGFHFWPMLAHAVGKDPSMTGRTLIYQEVWESIMKRPWLGYGFGGFWFPGSLESQRIGLAIGWPNIGYAENGVLELALQTGFVGVGLTLAFIARAVVQGVGLLRSPHYSPRAGWFLTILVLAGLTNIDAGWLMTSDTLDWVLIVVSGIGLNNEILRARSLASA
jgi:exopolysaccharide production protein ExoQ